MWSVCHICIVCVLCLQKTHWRAHRQAVLALDVIPGRNLIVAGSKDNNVTIWTFDGAQLGTLGEHT